jgi:endonuclease YncB( thermonuclease family)
VRLYRRLALIALITLSLAGTQELTAPVIRVIDGDTIEIEIDGVREKVRYIGINTPETNDNRPEVRAAARAATEANARLVLGRQVRLEFDVEIRDRYDRLLAYVWVGDTLVNEALVITGHAAPYTFPPNVRYVDRFVAAARIARARTGAPENVSAGTISAAKAAAHVGETMTVCGLVASTRFLNRGRRPTFLNLDAPYPDQALTVLIWGDSREMFGEPPEDTYLDQEICVTGGIELYRGKPQIVVNDPSSIQLRD